MSTVLTRRAFAAPDTTIVYDEGPDNGPPIVFIHSLGARRQDWAAVLPEFTRDRHVFALDLRGHGESGRVPGGYRFTEYAGDVRPFLSEIVGRPAALVGHSLGGVVAAVLAGTDPELLDCAIAMDPPLFGSRRSGDPTRYRERFRRAHELASSGRSEDELFTVLQARSPDRPEAISRALAGNLARLDPDVFTLALSDGSQIDFTTEDVIDALARRLLIVRADPANGAAASEEDVDWAAERNPLVSGVMIEGARHEIHHSHPAQFVVTVRRFLASH